jgi:hypothetical protein
VIPPLLVAVGLGLLLAIASHHLEQRGLSDFALVAAATGAGVAVGALLLLAWSTH